jgi:hypothetical protein
MTSVCQCYFETQHLQHNHPAMRELERDVLGCDFGGTSWTMPFPPLSVSKPVYLCWK